MKYPKEIGPQSTTEALAILFTMLGNAYNLLAQYEADERRDEDVERFRRMEESLMRSKSRAAQAAKARMASACPGCGADVDEKHAEHCTVWAAQRCGQAARPSPDFSGFSKSEAAHREDEQQ